MLVRYIYQPRWRYGDSIVAKVYKDIYVWPVIEAIPIFLVLWKPIKYKHVLFLITYCLRRDLKCIYLHKFRLEYHDTRVFFCPKVYKRIKFRKFLLFMVFRLMEL